jgi:hypothetical protein
MAHWFDRLAQPHTRRTTLKAAALGATAIALPNLRLPPARATTGEPCFQPCVNAANQAFDAQAKICGRQDSLNYAGSLLTASAATFFLGSLVLWNCASSVQLSWHQAVDSCRGSNCGNRGKYPGGPAPTQPPPKCTPGYDVVCGDRCCNVVAECCACSADPSGYCCCAAGKCGASGCV